MSELNQELAREAYEAHLPAAMALAPEEVSIHRVDPDIAMANIEYGMKVFKKHAGDIPKHLPEISVAELRELPSLALGTKMSSIHVDNVLFPGVSKSAMIAEGWKLRGEVLPVIEGLATTGAIPMKVYEKIAEGRGARDMAKDCVSMAQVFLKYDLAGKHSVSAETRARLEEVGTWLLKHLRKRHARKQTPETAAAVDIHDRMLTLLVQRYRKLRTVAYYFYQDAFSRHVPPLMSRVVSRKHEDEQQPSEPAPAPAPEGTETVTK